MFNFKHGHRAAALGSPERRAYDAWRNLRRRCQDERLPNYDGYGGRGITFDPAWNSYACFLSDMELPPAGLSIERKDNDGPYCRDNCKWATRREQNTNRRNTKWIEFDGQKKLIDEWAIDLGLPKGTLLYRFRRGWTTAEALRPEKFNRAGRFKPMQLA